MNDKTKSLYIDLYDAVRQERIDDALSLAKRLARSLGYSSVDDLFSSLAETDPDFYERIVKVI